MNCISGESSQNGSSAPGSHNEVSGTPHHPMLNQAMTIMPMPPVGVPGTVAGPTTNLNIGMDYWGAPTPSSLPAVHGKVSPATVPGSVVPNGLIGSREGVQPELWIQVSCRSYCSSLWQLVIQFGEQISLPIILELRKLCFLCIKRLAG